MTRGEDTRALYRKYRSLKLDDVLGQEPIVTILKRALAQGRIAHAYLLSGPRGTGKTSVARILAHEINQLPYTEESSHLDIIEIDAASNNGVDDIRSLRDKSRIAPVLAKYKVYIIDEVHMLSKSAFNALLKTLEEPPAHVVFIMATTDADKLPDTILSRVQQYHFQPISRTVISQHLISIAKKEGFELTDDAADLIAERSKGGFRDSLSLLDQLSNLVNDGRLEREIITKHLGLASSELIDNLIASYQSADTTAIISTIDQLQATGTSPKDIAEQLLATLRGQLASDPGLINLVRELIGVSTHPHPDMKLLTSLIKAPQTQPITTPNKSQPTAAVKATAPIVAEPSPAYQKPTPAPAPAKTVKKTKTAAATTVSQPAVASGKLAVDLAKNFSWQSFVDQARDESIGLYSLVAKCDYAATNSKLTIYGGNSFAKKMLDDSKNRQLISAILIKEYGDGIEIVVTGDKKPPSDAKLAAVAEMMGGGVEVSLEELS